MGTSILKSYNRGESEKGFAYMEGVFKRNGFEVKVDAISQKFIVEVTFTFSAYISNKDSQNRSEFYNHNNYI